MSFAHIRLKKIEEYEDEILYVALSPDFNEPHEWQEIARLVVSSTKKTHAFTPVNAWSDQKIVPPYVYGLPESEMRKALAAEFLGYSHGAWSGRILSQLRRMQETGVYPDETP